MSEQWYYRFLDQEIGPVDLETLRCLAADGSLAAADLVRSDSDPKWRSVESVAGILPAAADSDDLDAMLSDSPGTSDLEAMLSDSPGAADLDSMLTPSTPSTESDSRSKARGDCYCRLLGQELGPMSLDELTQLAVDGELSGADEVKLGGESHWVPAASVVGLIPRGTKRRKKRDKQKRQRVSDADIDAILHGEETQPDESPAAHVAPQRLAIQPFRTQSPPPAPETATRPSPSDKDARDAEPKSTQTSAATKAPLPALSDKPAPVHKHGPSSPAPPPTPIPQRASPSPAPPSAPRPAPPKKTSHNPFAGLSSGLGSLTKGLKGKGKPLLLVIGLVAVLGLVVVAAPFLGGGRGTGVYTETLEIWEEAMRLKASEAGPEQWKALSEKASPRVIQLADELEQEASAKERLLQLMLYCHRDCLPKILREGDEASDAVWEEMQSYMTEAAEIAAE